MGLYSFQDGVGLMNFWQRLLFLFGARVSADAVASSENSIELDETVVREVRALAEREQLPEEEVASTLLAFALARRYAAEEHLSNWYSLSDREQQVIAMACQNYTNQEIAERLCISQETVKSHIRNGAQKLGLHNKMELRRALLDWDFSAWEEEDGFFA